MAADRLTGPRGSADAAPAAPATPDAGRWADRQLVSAILARDRKATAQLVSAYTDPIYAYVSRRLAPRHDLVDDVVQEVFLAALDSLPTYRGTSSLQAWLLGIARHKVEGYYRDRLRRHLPLDDDGPEPMADELSIEEVLDRARTEAKTTAVLQQLPEAYSLALLWRYWENRSVRQIAEATGKTEKAVERLLARARTRFRTLWEGEL
jgi:RNA polymerase sigma factor (sigma-70 family)